MKDDYTKVQIKKTDITTGKDVIGATLQILDENGEVVEAYNSEGTIKTKLEWTTETVLDENGNEVKDEEGNVVAKEVTFTKLPVGKYILREVQAPTRQGYVHVDDVEFEVLETGEIQTAQMKDDYTKVAIKKTDITTVKDVIGATLQVLDENGEVVEAYEAQGTTKTKLEWTTEQAVDKDGNLVVDEDGEPVAKIVTFTKLPVGKYTLKEVQSPDAYVKAEDIEFEIVETDEIQYVGMKDDYTKVKFEKVDENGNFVGGASLRVKDLNGNEVASWVTNKEPHEIIKKLVPGEKYILEELEAPKDYEKAENIEFKVSEDGSEDIIRMVDKKIVNMPKTGQLFIIYYVLVAIAGASGIILFAKRRKEEKQNSK